MLLFPEGQSKSVILTNFTHNLDWEGITELWAYVLGQRALS